MSSGDAFVGGIETDPTWLNRLRSLNEVIASTGEDLRGNLLQAPPARLRHEPAQR